MQIAFQGHLLIDLTLRFLSFFCLAFRFQWVGSLDLAENEEANANILVKVDSDILEQEKHADAQVQEALAGSKLDAIVCVAGGWAGGNASSEGAHFFFI